MEVTFLREKDIWDDNALEVIQAYGTAVGISDVAIALGTMMGSGTKNSAGVASGYAWWASSYKSGNVRTVDYFRRLLVRQLPLQAGSRRVSRFAVLSNIFNPPEQREGNASCQRQDGTNLRIRSLSANCGAQVCQSGIGSSVPEKYP